MSQDPQPVPFIQRLADFLEHQDGFRRGTVAEATILETAADVVLTRGEGASLEIVCLVDRQTTPAHHIGLPPDQLRAIGAACLGHCGRIGADTAPLHIRIIEVVAGGIDAADTQRLGAYRRTSLRSKVMLSAWILAPEQEGLWTNAPWGGRFAGRETMRRVLADPTPKTAPRPVDATLKHRRPIATYGVLVAMVVMFLAELTLGIGTPSGFASPSVRTMLSLGALSPPAVLEEGQWYRALTALFLHANPLHLGMNAFVLVLAGSFLERMVGKLWFLALFILAGLGGSAASLAINPPDMISVGASGAILGVLTAALTCSGGHTRDHRLSGRRFGLVVLLAPALLPISLAPGTPATDLAAHVGGAVTGVIAGWLLRRHWPSNSLHPGHRRVAAILCNLALIGFIVAAIDLARDHRAYELSVHLVPPGQLPVEETDVRAQLNELLARYPRDPRLYWFRARAEVAANDYAGAEQALRAGLAEHEILKRNLSRELWWQMQGMLALIVAQRGDMDEARTLAQPVCRQAEGAQVHKILTTRQMCP